MAGESVWSRPPRGDHIRVHNARTSALHPPTTTAATTISATPYVTTTPSVPPVPARTDLSANGSCSSFDAGTSGHHSSPRLPSSSGPSRSSVVHQDVQPRRTPQPPLHAGNVGSAVVFVASNGTRCIRHAVPPSPTESASSQGSPTRDPFEQLHDKDSCRRELSNRRVQRYLDASAPGERFAATGQPAHHGRAEVRAYLQSMERQVEGDSAESRREQRRRRRSLSSKKR